MIRAFIGFDPREAVAFSVLAHSIYVRASEPECVAPLMLPELDGACARKRVPLQSTDFAFSRFVTPHLADYEGWSVLMDCDGLMLDDVERLWRLRDERYAGRMVHDALGGPYFGGVRDGQYAEESRCAAAQMLACSQREAYV
ncbi:MAG: hypothetical protein M5U08_17095 [Burkholderiales bacterium]|nr:hypothetical protein [Burkholderiales bacterium]